MKDNAPVPEPVKEETYLVLSSLFVAAGLIASFFLVAHGFLFICILMWLFICFLCYGLKLNAENNIVPTKKDDKNLHAENAQLSHDKDKEQIKTESIKKEVKFTPNVKREEYELLAKETEKLVRFIFDMCKRKDVKKAIDKVLLIRMEGNSNLIDRVDRIQYMIYADIKKGYEGLGHNLHTDDPELLGIKMFYHYFGFGDDDIDIIPLDYSNYEYLINTADPDFMETVLFDNADNINKAFKAGENDFIFQYILSLCNEDYAIQYTSLLYRFLSATAKADGTISEQEEKWLAKIANKYSSIRLSEGDPMHKEVSSASNNTESEKSAEEDLNELIGLATVKEDVIRLTNFVHIQQERIQRGMKNASVSYHCVFTGNPGTGKTTVARIIARIYKEQGILKKGQLIETDRSGLVAEYVGQTAVKTNKVIDSALDGVLFIDEAYSLIQGSKQDYGAEAVATLLKRMEDNRDRLVVILAGYENEMKQFIDSNPGLQSRFNRYIHFNDYSADELVSIFNKNVEKLEYKLTQDAEAKLKIYLQQAVINKDKNFGNARFVRNLFEKTLENQATRLASVTKLTTETLSEIKEEDIPMA